jgi:hypothetical protein
MEPREPSQQKCKQRDLKGSVIYSGWGVGEEGVKNTRRHQSASRGKDQYLLTPAGELPGATRGQQPEGAWTQTSP